MNGMWNRLVVIPLLLSAFPLFAQQDAETIPALRARVNLVVVDVVVTGRDGQPVHGLTASDFSVLENKTSQQIKIFEEHASSQAVRPPLPPLVPGAFTNYTRYQGGPLNVLLLDSLNTEPIDQAYMRQQVLKFLDQAKPGTQFAFFALDIGGLKILQGSTENMELLRAAVNNFHPMLGPFTGRVSPAEASLRPRYTLDSFSVLAKYLANISGRKNLIWFASHFQYTMTPDPNTGSPYLSSSLQADEFRDTVDLLSQNQVAIYPINAQGLTGSWRQMEDNLGASEIAGRSGGATISNTNDLSGVLARDIDLGSTYYTLAYAPLDSNYDGRYRSVRVAVKRPGVSLSYRHGYYADDPNRLRKVAQGQGKPEPSTAMEKAMTRGMPEPREILLFAQLRPLNTAPETTVAGGNKPSPKLKGPFQRFALDAIFDPRNLGFQKQPDGKMHTTVEFVALLYDRDNRVVNTVANDALLALTESPAALMEKGGVPVHQQISVPAKGDYFLRIAVHNKQSGRTGAIEIPISAVRNLPVQASVKQ